MQRHMAVPYGSAIWQSHMAVPYGNAILQCHLAMPYGFAWDQGRDQGPGTGTRDMASPGPFMICAKKGLTILNEYVSGREELGLK